MTFLVLVFLGFLLTGVVFLAVVTTNATSERTRRVRRREFNSARKSVNDINEIVNRYYPTADLVGQAMCDEIMTVITQHRKDMIK